MCSRRTAAPAALPPHGLPLCTCSIAPVWPGSTDSLSPMQCLSLQMFCFSSGCHTGHPFRAPECPSLPVTWTGSSAVPSPPHGLSVPASAVQWWWVQRLPAWEGTGPPFWPRWGGLHFSRCLVSLFCLRLSTQHHVPPPSQPHWGPLGHHRH